MGKNSMVAHNGHYLKCIGGRQNSMEFDVSYVYNADGELRFLF